MLDRIAWSRRSGEDVEHVIAMYLALDNPTSAEAITPSAGEAGIDIMVHLPDGGVAIYQVKKFAERLGADEKRALRRCGGE